jgi:uncharacterized RDD family membrane protein YckC
VDSGEGPLPSVAPPGSLPSAAPPGSLPSAAPPGSLHSVAPPGSPPPPVPPAASDTGSDGSSPTPPVHSVPNAPDAVLGSRIPAAIIDNIVVSAIYLVMCSVFGWRVYALSNLWVAVVLGIAYHFVLESRNGQTIGKRQYTICVRATDGQPARARAIAIRSVLRPIDQLPLFWASGFISMVRTGPERRQRIGDVLAHTTVVPVPGSALAKRTGGWVLPTATILSVLASLGLAYGIYHLRTAPLDSTQRAEFIQGCERGPDSVAFDCGCILQQLQAAGYVSLDDLRGLMSDAASENARGEHGPAMQALANAGLTCRR